MTAEIIYLADIRQQQRHARLTRELDDLRDLLRQLGPRVVECISFYEVPFLGFLDACKIDEIVVK